MSKGSAGRSRRDMLLGGAAGLAAGALPGTMRLAQAQPAPAARPTAPAPAAGPRRPNIVVIWGDDVGTWNISAYHRGMMGGSTPNIDRIANEGMLLMTHYAAASCTAGRAAFITGQYPIRVGLATVGLPGSELGLQKEDPDARRDAEAAGLRHRPVREEPSRRSRRASASMSSSASSSI